MKRRKKQRARKQVFDKPGLKAFALQLKKVRADQKLSQKQLAFEAGMSMSQVARIETAVINPTLSTIFSLSRALNVPVRSLFEFDLPPKK
jgi:transcriptional regulator with XRE-family HTH domain